MQSLITRTIYRIRNAFRTPTPADRNPAPVPTVLASAHPNFTGFKRAFVAIAVDATGKPVDARFRAHVWPVLYSADSRAVCLQHDHTPPYPDCVCGAYALKDRTVVVDSRFVGGTSKLAFATSCVLDVSLAGDVLEGTKGMRAQHQVVRNVRTDSRCSVCAGPATHMGIDTARSFIAGAPLLSHAEPTAENKDDPLSRLSYPPDVLPAAREDLPPLTTHPAPVPPPTPSTIAPVTAHSHGTSYPYWHMLEARCERHNASFAADKPFRPRKIRRHLPAAAVPDDDYEFIEVTPATLTSLLTVDVQMADPPSRYEVLRRRFVAYRSPDSVTPSPFAAMMTFMAFIATLSWLWPMSYAASMALYGVTGAVIVAPNPAVRRVGMALLGLLLAFSAANAYIP